LIFTSLGALPQLLVWDRQSGLHGSEGRPTQEYAAFCGQLRVDWYCCEPADPQAKGVVERGLDREELRAGAGFRQRARLPAANGHVVFAARQPASSQAAALPSDRQAAYRHTGCW
jgi:hypothetical protein